MLSLTLQTLTSEERMAFGQGQPLSASLHHGMAGTAGVPSVDGHERLSQGAHPNSSSPLTRPSHQLSTRMWQACPLPLECVTVNKINSNHAKPSVASRAADETVTTTTALWNPGGRERMGSRGVLHKATGIQPLGLGIP